ncbi:MAG: hypothetical protein AAFO04_13435 [Cyanobacteria bacterium J06592_8]
MARHVYGLVDDRGSIIQGSGFRVQRFDNGFYLVEFSTPFNSVPVVVATTFGHPWSTFNISTAIADDVSSHHFFCLTSTPERGVDCGFSFIVIGD